MNDDWNAGERRWAADAILQLRRMAIEGPLSTAPWLARLREKNGGIPYGIALAAAGLVVYPDTALWIAARSI